MNKRIVERLRLMQQLRTQERMLEFRVGQRVSFEPEGRGVQFGVLLRRNKKTMTVLTEGGEQWKVSPGLLRRVVDVEPSAGTGPNVIALKKA